MSAPIFSARATIRPVEVGHLPDHCFESLEKGYDWAINEGMELKQEQAKIDARRARLEIAIDRLHRAAAGPVCGLKSCQCQGGAK